MDAKRPLGFAIAASKKLCQRSHVKTCTGGAKCGSSVLSWPCRYALPVLSDKRQWASSWSQKMIVLQTKAQGKKFAQERIRASADHEGTRSGGAAESQAQAKERVRVHQKIAGCRQPSCRQKVGRALLPDSFVLSGKDRGRCSSALLCSPCLS